jgi:hypothetical protein
VGSGEWGVGGVDSISGVGWVEVGEGGQAQFRSRSIHYLQQKAQSHPTLMPVQ